MRRTNARNLQGRRLEMAALLPSLIVALLTGVSIAGAVSAPPHFDVVHGRQGYWQIAKTAQGVWWFVSPQGKPEFLNMVTTVQPTLRGLDANGADYISRDFDDQDPASLDRWAKATVKRLSDTGFKGVGAWSNPILHNYDIPMTQDLNLSGWTHGQGSLIFSPDWPTIIERAIKAQTEPLRENKNLVGYFIDNEPRWDDEAAGPAAYFDGLPSTDPNRREVIEMIRSIWTTPAIFNRDWNAHIADWATLDGWQALPRQAEAYQQLASKWLSHLAETYFTTTCALLRKHDPNHLILGVRFRGNAPIEVIRASRNLTDAQSLNYYVCDAKLDADLFKMISEEAQQPIIISEFSFHCLDNRSGDRNSIGFDAQVLDQHARADAYRLFASRAARVPYVIGADWFQWMDEPPSGRLGDGEDVNFGVVDVDDRPYDSLVDAVRSTAPLLDGLHEGSIADKQSDVWRESFAERASFNVPLLTHPIRINGELSDWPAESKLASMHPGLAIGSDREQLPLPNVHLGWTDKGLFLAFEVFDRDVSAAPATGSWWARDSVEFWISTRPVQADQRGYTPYCHHFFFVPVETYSHHGISGIVGQWHSPGDGLRESLIPQPDIKSVTRILHDRYVTEIFIPARALNGWDPHNQPQLAFNIHIRNFQHAAEYFWSAPKQVLTQARPSTWGTIYLLPTPIKPQPNLVADVHNESK